MQNQVKVPKEIQELFFEAEACNVLAAAHMSWWVPSPKVLYYTLRRDKVTALAWRTLERLFSQRMPGWTYDMLTCTASAPLDVSVSVEHGLPKKPRAPRKPKASVTPAATPGAA